mgnify:CR=1 FL=1
MLIMLCFLSAWLAVAVATTVAAALATGSGSGVYAWLKSFWTFPCVIPSGGEQL